MERSRRKERKREKKREAKMRKMEKEKEEREDMIRRKNARVGKNKEGKRSNEEASEEEGEGLGFWEQNAGKKLRGEESTMDAAAKWVLEGAERSLQAHNQLKDQHNPSLEN
ncbi:hypothetical protein R1flu_013644 [Riccia fluitans]|uniref:Uncharacterized protein n=1 Tax=Riccia fluitans TaxID=41844 RepID=A0ABD1YE56_9MARC